MKIAVVTLFPELVAEVTACGVVGRAAERGLLELEMIDPRSFAQDRHRSVDDRPYGGGPGMVMKVEPLRSALRAATMRVPRPRTVYLGPQGRVLTQAKAEALAQAPGLVLLAGRYEGVDQRVLDTCIDEELSIGDYVLSGGELAAMVVIDVVARLLPGVLGDERSAREDCFADGLLGCPQYTRPEEIDGLRVPEPLLSGDHARVARWRLAQRLGRTHERRPELLEQRGLNPEELVLLEQYLDERRKERNEQDH